MRKIAVLTGVLAVLAGAAARAEDPKMPTATKEHEWLKQFAGEWVSEGEMVAEPGKPAVKCKGTESARMIGDFWSMGEMKGEYEGIPVTGIMTLGFDAEKKKYVGTWVCSMDGYLWKYEGELDSTGKILTLNTEGPDFTGTGKIVKMRDVVELKGPDHKVMSSQMQGPDGKWVTFMTMTAKKKKAAFDPPTK